MAQEQEEIIIIEESDAAGIEKSSQSNDASVIEKPKIWKNKRFIVALIAGTLLLSFTTGAIFLFSSHGEGEALKKEPLLNKTFHKKSNPLIEQSQLEKMIEQANYLYANGNQTDALKLYEKIALYSEAISQYNLGVVQLREGEYTGALTNFKHSIDSSENQCVSAINAAVCCLHLGRDKEFNDYINMAASFLPQESTSPLYSYYYALINYYQGHYLEALSALKHPMTDEYQTVQNKLHAKISSMYGSYDDALSALTNPVQEEDSFSLGLLSANLGDLEHAKKYLNDAIIQNPKPIQEQLALAFVELKSGFQSDAANHIKEITTTYPDQVYTPYPIRVFLKPSLFNPDDVQNFYRYPSTDARYRMYQNIFYFAPYKIYNANQTINDIRKGNANIYIDDIESAKEYLQKSTRSSSIDYGITLAVQKALNFRLRDANKDLSGLLKINSQHSVLHYNLALTYAQLGDYSSAYDHFSRSYNLDADNYLAGIFALMCSDLIAKNNPKLSSIIQDNLAKEPEKEEFELYRTLINITQNNFPGAGKWLDSTYKERPLYLALKSMIALKLQRLDVARDASEKLIHLQPHDMIPHFIYIDTHFQDLKPKAYASASLNYLKKQAFRYDDLYFGPKITRDNAILMGIMTGQLAPMINRLEDKLQTTADNTIDITEALAQSNFYNQNFEEAYTLYNQLIDTYKIKDEQTLFNGAAASIGAEHYENAIALLELSKIKNPNFVESRYALGLLYLQIQNNPGSYPQFNLVGNKGFISHFFDFDIDTDKLSNEPKKYHPL
ncbi:MAG: tetratricopeptide repeat protein [Sulfuricurvum sp.]|nr:tetratricopeptide repeat protein [Sulfuricurvum sp.]